MRDVFHHEICNRTKLPFVWDLIDENKGHMDRLRMLTRSFALRTAWEDHLNTFDALKSHDPDAASTAMRTHLCRIKEQIDRILSQNHDFFQAEPAEGGAGF